MREPMRSHNLKSRLWGFRIGNPLSSLKGAKSILPTILAIAALGSIVISCASGRSRRFAEVQEGAFTPMIKDIKMLEVGDKAPLFEVSDVLGNRFALSERIGKHVIVLVFWSVYCEPCKGSMPAFNEIYNKYHAKGLDFYAVNMDGAEMTNTIRAFTAQENIKLTVLLDEPEGDLLKVADPYGVQGTPTIYIIDRSGRITFARAGTVPYEELSSEIRKELEKR